jgi:hypothetical protein
MKITKEYIDVKNRGAIWKPMQSGVNDKAVMKDYLKVGYICLI